MFKYAVAGFAGFVFIFAFLAFSCKLPTPNCEQRSSGPTGQLMMWGPVPRDKVEPLILEFNNFSRTYTLSYEEIPKDRFNSILVNELANGRGPDLILADYQTILMQRERVYPYPYESFSQNDFRNAYVNGANVFLADNGILALPISIEPLMLFSNRTIFAKHGVASVPSTWEEVLQSIPQLRVWNEKTRALSEYAIALGASNNVLYMKDILSSLVKMLGRDIVTIQGGVPVISANTPIDENSVIFPLREALRLYAQFSDSTRNTTYTWNPQVPYTSLDAFASERLAMFLGFSGDKAVLLEKNPRLDFTVAELPQATGYPTRATAMRLYGVAVLKRTPTNLLPAALAAVNHFGGAVWGTRLAEALGGVSPLRGAIANNRTIEEPLRRSVLVASGWYDIYADQSTQIIASNIDALITGRKEATSAADDIVNMLNGIYNR